MIWLPITLTMAAVGALINIWLMMRVGSVRRASGVFVGDGGDDRVIRRMRAHANFVETAPFVLILILALEAANAWHTGLWAAGTVWALGRLAHPFGMDGSTRFPARMIGTIATLLVMLILAVWAILTAHGMVGTETMPARA